MSGLNPEDMQDAAQFWDVSSFQLIPSCPHCETGLCSGHSSDDFLNAAMDGFSLQGYPSPIGPDSNYALQVSTSPMDFAYPTTVMSDTFSYPYVSPQSLTGIDDHENRGNHDPFGRKPSHLQIDTGVLGDIYGPIPSSANTDDSAVSNASSISFLPTSEESRTIKISDDGSDFKHCVGSEAMKAASKRRRKKQGLGSFFCKYCDDNLTSSHNLKYHVNAHFGVRPYQCQFLGCNFTTTAPATVKRHRRTCKYRQS